MSDFFTSSLFSSSSSSSSSSWDPSSSSSSSTGNGHSDLYNQLQTWYQYQPVPGLAVAAFILFGLLATVLWVQAIRYRHWYTFALPVAATLECVGYIGRYLTTKGDGGQGVFTLQLALILIVPNVFAFTNYSTVGRILKVTTPLPGSPTWLRVPVITDSTGAFLANRIAAFFFVFDIAALVIQVLAVPFLTSSSSSEISTGQTIVEIGLAVALASVALFLFVTCFIYFSPRYRLSAHPQYAHIQKMFVALFVTITLLSIRSLYRLVEYCVGYTGYLNVHEAFLYSFDTLLMLITCTAYCLYPFGKYLNEIYAAEDAGKEGKEADAVSIEMERGAVSPAPTSPNVVMVSSSNNYGY